MVFSHEPVTPLKKSNVQKDIKLYKRVSEDYKNFENFGAKLEEVFHCFIETHLSLFISLAFFLFVLKK